MSLAEEVRRCPKCGKPELRAVHITRHVRRGRGDTIGHSGVFTCAACGETVSVMDPGLLFVFGFTTLLGVPFALYLTGAGVDMLDAHGDAFVLALGFVICGGLCVLGVGWMGWFLAKMMWRQARSPVVSRPRPVAPPPSHAAPGNAAPRPAKPPEPEGPPDELDLEIRALERARRTKVALIVAVVLAISITPCAVIGYTIAQ